jgi:hypothetical protein
VTAAWTTPAKDWSTGDPITAAELDTHIRDNMDYLQQEFVAKLGQWTSYVPTVTQSGSVSKTVTYSRYLQFGKFVTWGFVIAITGSGTSANAVTLSLPATAVFGSSNRGVGQGGIYDTAPGVSYQGRAVLNSTTTIAFVPSNVTTGGYLGSHTFTAALASGDIIEGQISYEAA